jgi:hypothetical protein
MEINVHHPVTVSHNLPADAVEVVPALLVASIANHISAAASIGSAVNAENLDAANAAVIALHRDHTELTAVVERIKKPLNQAIKAVRTCHENAEGPLLEAKRSLTALIGKWNSAEATRKQAEYQAALDRAREEAAKAEEERRRLQAEADAKHAAAVKEAQEKADAEAKEIADLLGTPAVAEPVKVAPAPVVVAPKAATVAIPEPEKSDSAIQTRMVPVLIIDDAKLIPSYIGETELRPIDKAAIKRAIEAGVSIPGAHIEKQPQYAMGRGK